MTLRGCALFGFLVTACESDVTSTGGDVLAEDSTLALEVFGARPDSVAGFDETVVEVESLEPDAPAVVTSNSVPAATQVPVIRPTASVRETAKTAKPAISRSAGNTAIRRPRVTASSRPRRAESRVRTTDRVAVASRGWLVLPAGAQIELESEQQLCSRDAGDGFEATVSSDVIAANGVIIPDGASARGEILSTDAAEPTMRIQWITFGGRMYEVSTRVTHADTKRVRTRSSEAKMSCVPDGGRIVAELTRPLRVALND
jgi:hypothetical protein